MSSPAGPLDGADIIRVGEPLPHIGSVEAAGGLAVTLTWRDGSRAGLTETVDLAPLVLTFTVYRELREDAGLFAKVHVVDGGQAIAWKVMGPRHDGPLDMSAAAIGHLAERGADGAVRTAGSVEEGAPPRSPPHAAGEGAPAGGGRGAGR